VQTVSIARDRAILCNAHLVRKRVSTGTEKLTLFRFPAFQFGEDLHVAVKAGRTPGEVLADGRVRRLVGMLGHTRQFRITWTAITLRIGESLGKIRLGEPQEFFFLNILSSFWIRHRFAPSIQRRRGRLRIA
jgi:hypothetical protein